MTRRTAAADRRVGLPARAERAPARVDAEPPRVRAVDDQERRDVLVRRLHAAQVEGGIQDGLDRGQHHREVFRRQPAITALAATFSTVATPPSGSISPSEAWRSSGLCPSISSMRPSVGGTMGSPSVQPRST